MSDRRGFLGTLAGVAVASLVPFRGERAPKLWSDFRHDDSDALQWRINRRIPIIGGTYLVAGPLLIHGPAVIRGAHFRYTTNPEYFVHSGDLLPGHDISYNTFEGAAKVACLVI